MALLPVLLAEVAAGLHDHDRASCSIASSTIRPRERDGCGRGRPWARRPLLRDPGHDQSQLGGGTRHFEEAIGINVKLGALPWLAHTKDDYAHMLLKREQPGDRDRALALLSEAVATYEELGMERAAQAAQLQLWPTSDPAS